MMSGNLWIDRRAADRSTKPARPDHLSPLPLALVAPAGLIPTPSQSACCRPVPHRKARQRRLKRVFRRCDPIVERSALTAVRRAARWSQPHACSRSRASASGRRIRALDATPVPSSISPAECCCECGKRGNPVPRDRIPRPIPAKTSRQVPSPPGLRFAELSK